MSSDLADATINMVLDHNLISMHLMRNKQIIDPLKELVQNSNNEDTNHDPFIATRITRFRLMYLVYDRCSMDVVGRFFKREYERKLLEVNSSDSMKLEQERVKYLIELWGIVTCTRN